MVLNKQCFFTYTLFCLLSAVLFACAKNQLFANQGANMANICNIPEDLSAFKVYINNKVGQDISEADIERLKNELGFKIDYETKEVTDIYHSWTEKVNVVLLGKSCIAPDGVSYRFELGVITDLMGNAVFSQHRLRYHYEDMLNGYRRFSFDNIFLSENFSEYAKLISKEVVGVMDKNQLTAYMEALGCTKLKSDKADVVLFVRRIDTDKDFYSRIFILHDFKKKIIANFNAEGIVKEIVVTTYKLSSEEIEELVRAMKKKYPHLMEKPPN